MRLSPATRFNLFIFGTLLLLLTYAGCGGRDLFGDVKTLWGNWFGPKTPREAYRKALVRSEAVSERDLALWDAAYAVAKTTPLSVNLPHREVLSPGTDLLTSPQSLRLTAPPGRRVRIRAVGATAGPLSGPLFGELFLLAQGTAPNRPLQSWDTLTREIVYETRRNRPEELVLVVQSPPRRAPTYELRITTEPVLLFPVRGKDERAIQSFWGAARDGGRRKHEGNDVFAPRGTELLAPTDGRITRVSNGGLGGKTVWLRDGKRGLRYYFAHLDEQLVTRGQYVERGDVVGTVGNTGNARTTPPHLHFGIYAKGAIDPYPFLRSSDALPPPPQYPLPAPAAPPTAGEAATRGTDVPASGNHFLRLQPERDGAKIRRLDNGEAVTALGATGRFYRVLTGRGELGYVNFD